MECQLETNDDAHKAENSLRRLPTPVAADPCSAEQLNSGYCCHRPWGFVNRKGRCGARLQLRERHWRQLQPASQGF